MQVDFWNGKRAPGISDEINLDQYENAVEVFEEAFKQYADRPAFTNLGLTLTYADIDRLSADFAAYIQNETDLQPGDRIAIQMPNLLQYPVILYGAMRAGLIIVNTNPLYTAREMKHQFNDSGAKALVFVNLYGDLVEEVLPETDIKYVIQTTLGDMLPFVKRTLINTVVKRVKKMVPAANLPTAIPFRSVLKKGSSYAYKPVAIKAGNIAMLQYTGGTTGVAKGAMLLHRNLTGQMAQMKAAEGQLGSDGVPLQKKGQEIIVGPLPLYHIYAFMMHCMMAVSSGNHSVLITNPREPSLFIKAIKPFQFTALTGIETLFVGLMDHPEFASLDFSKLKLTVSGGAALSKPTAERWEKITGCPVTEGYGLTECSPGVSANPANGLGQLGTIGMPMPGTTVKAVDDDGNEVGFGEPGELCVKGPQVMQGYWQRPEATAETIDEDGWLKTGDIAVIAEDGYISIVDRKKDMILVSGFNVFPNEIEEVVVSHPKVELCACIGVKDEKSGEAPKIFVVKSDATLTVDEIKAHCKKNLTGYKLPRHIEFRDELPMTAVGKILRKDLREPESA